LRRNGFRARPSDALRCAIAHRGMTDMAVNSREKPNNLRILPARPYIHDRLATASRLRPKSPHALHAPIPRRTARPASGFGSRGPARQAEEGGAGGQGAVAASAGAV